MDVDPKRTTSQDIIQIGTMDVPVDLNDQVETSAQKGHVAINDHEVSESGCNSR
jgi:hypothetical protein